MRRLLALSLLGLATAATTAFSCGSDNNGPAATGNVSIVSGASTKTTTAFSPNPYTSSLATPEVKWANNDNVVHHLVSDTPLFDTGDLSANATFTFAFLAAGTYPYHCSIHPGMVGTITITE